MTERNTTNATDNSAMLDDLAEFFHFHVSRGGWTRVALVLGGHTGQFVNLWPSDKPDVPWDGVWVLGRLRMLLAGGYVPLAWVFRCTPERLKDVPKGFFDKVGLFGMGLPQPSVCGVSVQPFLKNERPGVDDFAQRVLEHQAREILKDVGLGAALTPRTRERKKRRVK